MVEHINKLDDDFLLKIYYNFYNILIYKKIIKTKVINSKWTAKKEGIRSLRQQLPYFQ